MNYTDKELIRASQVAYFVINDQVMADIITWIDNEKENGNTIEPNYTLFELFNHSETFRKSAYNDICNFTELEYNKVKDLTRNQILSYAEDEKGRQMISERLDIIKDIKNGEIGSWKVVSYVDNNTIGTAGMAGKLVDGK